MDEEVEEDFLTKHRKLNSEPGEDKFIELNTNSNNASVHMYEETCPAKKKLDNIFNKHI